MENVAADRLVLVQGKEPPLIVTITLDKSVGHAVLDNGTPLEFEEPSALALLRTHKCVNEAEIHSYGASQGFMRTSKDGKSIWGYILIDTCKINFYGTWDPALLAFILSKALKLDAVSFTYWQCSNPAMVLSSIKSDRIRELSMQVGLDQHMIVIKALEGLAPRARLERLILVFENAFKRDIILGFQKRLAACLASGAQIILLFGGEDDCIKSLKDDGYLLDGQIRMAANSLYEPQSHKVYEIYEVFHKNCCNATWRIGSRIGKYQPIAIPPLIPLAQSCIPNVEDVLVRPGDRALRWDTVNNGKLSKDEHSLVNGNYNYGPYAKLIGYGICCQFDELPADDVQVIKKWKIPGWTREIRKLIYNGQLTEMLTSNGFYIVLDQMKDEVNFFATMKTTPRFVFMCTTSHRLCIVTANMKKFLADAYHIEFIGTWYSKIIEEIAPHFTTRLYALTMMQIEFHTTRPLIWIFNVMSQDVKRNLRVFHFDARATNDWSVGSVVNAILKQKDEQKNRLMKFEELIIISNKWQCQQGPHVYYCRLFKHIEDCVMRLLVPGGSANTVVMQDLPQEDYLDADFFDPPFHVIVPIAYPHRGTVNGLTRLMNGYSDEWQNYRYSIAVPGHPLL